MFAGPWGYTAYSWFIGCSFLLVVILFVNYSAPGKSKRSPLIWLAATFIYLYLFQSNSRNWYSICGGMNYLFPMIPTLLLLSILPIVDRSRHFNNPSGYILLLLLGIATGWSQECFSLPLSGGLFFYLLLNYKKTRARTWLIAISLWTGTAILVFAPGNFVRLANSPGLLSSLINGVKLLIGTRLFWILAAGALCLRIWNKALFKNFLQQNILGLLILAVALAFGLVANTLPQSFNGISFYSAILLFRLLATVSDTAGKRIPAMAITVVLAIPMFVHQTRIISTSKYISQVNHKFVENYMASSDGVMLVPEVYIPADVKPFTNNWFTNQVRWWLMFTLCKHYGDDSKPIKLLNAKDYSAYSNREEFILTNKPLDCCQNIYQGDGYVWFDKEAPQAGDTVFIKYEPSKTEDRLKFLRGIKNRITGFKIKDEQQRTVDESNIITGRNGLVGIPVENRPIENVYLIKH